MNDPYRPLPIINKIKYCGDCNWSLPKHKPRKYVICGHPDFDRFANIDGYRGTACRCLIHNKKYDCEYWEKEVKPKGFFERLLGSFLNK